MGFRIENQKFFNQFSNREILTYNSSDFTTNLVGNVGDIIRTTFDLTFWQVSQSTAADLFNIVGGGNTLTRVGPGSFIADEHKVGDLISLRDNALPGVFLFEDRIITSITATEVIFDGVALVLSGPYNDMKLYNKTDLNEMRYKFGIIGNTEATNYISKIDGTAENAFSLSNITTVGTEMIPDAGVNSWNENNNASRAEVSAAIIDIREKDYQRKFFIQHWFRIQPYYLEGEIPNIQNNLKPSLFSSGNSLKYVFQAEVNENLSNPNTSRFAFQDDNLGSVGWFNENINGNAPTYSASNVSYLNVDTGLAETAINAQETTKVTFKLNSDNGIFLPQPFYLQPFILGISILPDASEYQQNQNFINENFLLETLYMYTFYNGHNGYLIKNAGSSFISANELEVYFEVDYPTLIEEALEGVSYVIWVAAGDYTLPGINTDRVTCIIDSKEFIFNPDTEDLLFCDKTYHFPHTIPDTNLGLSFDNYAGWIEDGFEVKIPFYLSTGIGVGGALSSFKLHLSAWNSSTDDIFRLQSYSYNLANAPLIQNAPFNDYYAYNIISERNFNLVNGSQFNKAELITTGPEEREVLNHLGQLVTIPVVGYEATLGIKANFEKWISQPGANTVFYDVNAPVGTWGGLNKNASNYSLKEGYSLIVEVDAEVWKIGLSGFLNFFVYTTNYKFLSQPHEYYDYDLDNQVTPLWSVEIITYNELGQNTQGVLDVAQDMRIKAIFTPLAGVTNLINPYGIIRLNESGGNINTIYELSTVRESIINNPLIPLDGESYTKLTDDGLTVELECLVKGSLIDAAINYDISATLRESSNVNGIETENDIFIETENDDILIIE
jgi:hypothetical protein